ncbi:amino acid permease [Clostridium estertheticum]|uniref:amino acid permease n=1 Tax=Clostridium estertheticum TaxID=238834 RepID=UPI001C7CEC35|nr:amino acid permease [Clostridium estertheticum]MBX4261241.1 amino acid permease [Clostridium estertheticum]WLC71719.1 amino acid permease [Clostridium estertheticum]
MSSKTVGSNQNLKRGLEERHIQLMALGGAIGTGLFLGSSGAIKAAGPSILLVYAIGGAITFYIMRALGEMAVENPVAGSFCAYAHDYIGPLAGYLTGWTYWLNWISACMAEVTGIGIYTKFWYPSVPQWTSALIALTIMIIINLITVKAFGEFEFWFAIIKVVTIIAMIIVGTIMITTGLGNGGKAFGISNLWTNGGFFPHGITGPIKALVLVTFSFFGVELIGVTAGEARNPEKTIPSAINKVFWRICIFYVGSMAVIMSIYPWNQLGLIGSPFVLVFSNLGIKAAAGIINFVVLTAALSSCNSGIFTTGRMVYNLSLQGSAPKVLAKLSKAQVPMNAILASTAVMFIGVILNLFVPGKVFLYVAGVATFAGIFAWFMILLSQVKFRKSLTPEQVKKLKFPMKGYPYMNYICFAYLALVIGTMCMTPEFLLAVIVGPIWLAVLTICYYVFGLNKKNSLSHVKNKESM